MGESSHVPSDRLRGTQAAPCEPCVPLASYRHKRIASYIGQRIRKRRMELHLNQADVGAGVGGITQQAMSYIERTGEVNGTQLLQLSQVLRVSVSYFFEEFEERTTDDLPPAEVKTA